MMKWNCGRLTPACFRDMRRKAEKSRVFIVDDHAMFRDGIRQVIDLEPDLMVCGDAPSVDEALRGIGESKPDLVIVDVSLAGAQRPRSHQGHQE